MSYTSIPDDKCKGVHPKPYLSLIITELRLGF